MEGEPRRGQEEPRRVTFVGNHVSEFTLHISGFPGRSRGLALESLNFTQKVISFEKENRRALRGRGEPRRQCRKQNHLCLFGNNNRKPFESNEAAARTTSSH